MHACAILLTSSAIMSGDKTCVTFFLAWHLAFHLIECGLAWTSSVHWIGCGLAWMPSASAMNPAPCCIDLCCYVHSSLLHWPLPPLSVSSICPFMLSWKCQVPKFSPAWHSIIVLHEVFLPLLWSYRVSPGPGCQPISNSMRVVFLMFYQLSFTLGFVLTRCSGVSHDVLVVTARTYYVSPLVRRAFLHQSILFRFVSPLSAGRFSINLGYQSLIIMVDNNVLVCGRVFRTTSSAHYDG